MNYIDPHIHMYSRVTDDYEKMALAGIRTVIEPSFWLGQQRTSSETLIDYWEHIISFEHKRASEFGINHFCTISVNPKEANNVRLAEDSLKEIKRYLDRDTVVGIGEIGFDDITKQEEKVFTEQLLLAGDLDLPVIIHTPHINKLEGTKKTLDLIKKHGITEKRVIVDHNTEETIGLVLETEVMAGLSVYPHTKLTPIRAANILKKYGTDKILINSSADWGVSDPLSVPKTAMQMEKDGFGKTDIEKVLYKNPFDFFKQSKNFKINA